MYRILLILLFLCFPALGQQPPQENEMSGPKEQRDTNSQVQESDIAILIESLQTTVDYLSRQIAEENYADDYSREGISLQRRDLQAQSSMEVSTWIMALVAVPSLGLALIGVVFIGRTLVYTRNAATDTREMLRVAIKTYEQCRAWITPSVSDPGSSQQLTTNDGTRAIAIPFSNTGESPALNVRWRMGISRTDKINIEDYPKAVIKEFPIVDVWRHIGVVGKGERFPCWVPVSTEWANAMKEDKQMVIVQIECSYNTIFSEMGKKQSVATYHIGLDRHFADRIERFTINPISHSNVVD